MEVLSKYGGQVLPKYKCPDGKISGTATLNSSLQLKETIAQDCKYWENAKNKGGLYQNYMYLNQCRDSEKTGLYQLILNGRELWYGTLQEINAVVKSMCALIDRAADYEY